MPTVTIYHLDDEPDTLQWIPGSLLNHYWGRWPNWIHDDGTIEWTDQEQTATFRLYASAAETTVVRYRFFASLDEFAASVPEITARDLVLLDLMTPRRVGDKTEWDNVGFQAFDLVRDRVGPRRVLFLTGWTPRIAADVRAALPPGHVMSKPVNAHEFILKLAEMLKLDSPESTE